MEKGKQPSQLSSEKLPREIMEDILSRLPVKSLMRFRCVCKSWCSLVINPRFVKLHLNRATQTNNLSLIVSSHNATSSSIVPLYSVEDFDACDGAVQLHLAFETPIDHVYTVGYCNGLLCFTHIYKRYNAIPHGDLLYLWNPAIKEYKKLPPLPGRQVMRNNRYCNSSSGFGYDLTTEEYKVVVVRFSIPGGGDNLKGSCLDAHVYTLGTDQWRQLGVLPDKLLLPASGVFESLYLNGGIHWFASSNFALGDKSIIYFDLGKEEFKDLLLPDGGRFQNDSNMTLGELEGCLFYSHLFIHERIEIWVMKEFGVRESWTKQFIIERGSVLADRMTCLDPLGFLKNGEVLLNQNNKKLILYDPITKKVRDLLIRRTRSSRYVYTVAYPFIWTLVSPGVVSARSS